MDEGTRTKKIRFILEADKLKGIIRNTLLTDQSRLENAAEHSWHAALTALVVFDISPIKDMDLTRILKMLLVHDLVEIDTGDVSCYEKGRYSDRLQRERQAAERIFNLLPENQAHKLRQLWEEFEAGQTPEALFAHAADRLQPLLQAVRTGGRTWRQHNIGKDQVIERMQPIRTALPSLWGEVVKLIEETLP